METPLSNVIVAENNSVAEINQIDSVDILAKEEKSRKTWNILKGIILLVVGFCIVAPIYIITGFALSGGDTPEMLSSDDKLLATAFIYGFPIIAGGFFIWAAFKIMTNKVTVSEEEKHQIITLHDDMHPDHEQAKRKRLSYFLMVTSGVLLAPSYFFGSFMANFLIIKNLDTGIFLFFLIIFVVAFINFKKGQTKLNEN